jgi:HAD superfamily hydrolase (TIGR01509 family)
MTLLNEIKLIIFDCDGVLIDSETLSQKVLLSLLKEKGAEVDEAYFNAFFLGRTFESVIQKVKQDFSVILDETFRDSYREELFNAFDKGLKTTNNIESMLTSLSVKSCVATSSSPVRVAHSLLVTGLQRFFTDRVYTASLVANGKPAPDIFLYAAKQMGIEPKNCLVIEDSQSGIKAGLAANMKVIQFNGATHMAHHGNSAVEDGIEVIRSWPELQSTYPNIFS